MRTALVILLALAPALVSAQSIELFATTGVVQLWNDESRLGLGIPIGAGVGFHSPHGWGIEALVDGQRASRRFVSDVRFDSTLTAGRARLLKYFGRGEVQAYAGAGLGVSKVKSTFDYPPACTPANPTRCASRDIHRSASTSGTLSGHVGVRFATGSMFVRPEFELSRAGEHIRMGGTVAIGARW